MADMAGWVALVATCVAALMTASNLGARVTGWGFVIFTVGAVGWIVVGFATGQQQLLYSNLFLGLVDLFGVWRWLGRRARISDASRAEEDRSTARPGETLFSVASLDGLPVKAADGTVAAHAVDALASCAGGGIDYLVVRVGGLAGIAETLHRLPWSDVTVRDGEVVTKLPANTFPNLAAAGPR
ncbi:PRC-barrel domain containing protein [Sphingomonas rubra]|uniref:PRC-barrel domain-containing protein n=1 Tax=Sphingomonas rubra TaxID=634430 RepID=A0A1I5RFV7_9SPHN|nr:PRC-barrel domain containing protein [Sphingomonas rubra]SFP57458.1 hypothetical protein SAMN04488241_103235 [Sphingomonas rubra]